MVEGLKRFAQIFELPSNIGNGIRLSAVGAGINLPGAPAFMNSAAGDEIVSFFADGCMQLRENRVRLSARAKIVEKQFADEARSINALAGEWKTFQKTVGSLESINTELKRVRERIDALAKVCEDIEMACTVCTESLEREKAEREAVKRTQTLEEKKLAAKRKNERLERSLDEKAQHIERESQGEAKKRVEEYKRKVEEAFDRAAKKDFSDWITGKTQRKNPSAPPTPAAKPAESKPLPLDEEKAKFEKMLEGVEPVVPEKNNEEAAEPASEEEKKETTEGDSEAKKNKDDEEGSQEDESKKTHKQKVPKVLGDVDVL